MVLIQTEPKSIKIGTTDIKRVTIRPNGTEKQIRPAIKEYDIDITNFKSTTSYSGLNGARAGCFSMDGMKYYVSQNNTTINEYTLNNKYDLSSAAQTNSITAGGQVHQVYISPDGKHLGCVTYSSNTYMRELTTPNDITTATNLKTSGSFYRAVGMWFKPDGTRMYIGYYNSNGIRQYNLSTPRDITTATDVGQLATGSERGVTLSSDGTILIRCDSSNSSTHTLYQYSLSTPRNITTATQTKTLSESIGAMFALSHDDSILVCGTLRIGEFYEK